MFFTHTDGESVATPIVVTIVSKTIFREVSRKIKEDLPKWNGLLDIRYMQSPFNAFSKGIVEYGQETEYSASAFLPV